METERFALIVSLVLIVVVALVTGARKFLEKYAPTTATTKDDEWVERLQRIEDILTGISAANVKDEDKPQG